MREMSLLDAERNGSHEDPGLMPAAAADHGPAPYEVALNPGGGGEPPPVEYSSAVSTPTGTQTYGAGTEDLGRALKTQRLLKQWVGDPGNMRFIGERR